MKFPSNRPVGHYHCIFKCLFRDLKTVTIGQFLEMEIPVSRAASASVAAASPLFGILSFLCGLMPLGCAIAYIGVEVRRRSGPFGIDGDYSEYAICYMILTIISMAIGIQTLRNRRGGCAGLVASLITLMFTAISLPSNWLDPASAARRDVQVITKAVGGFLVEDSQQHGHFPGDESQLREAEWRFRLQWLGEHPGPYARGRMRVPYKLVYMANAAGPHLSGPLGPEPSLLYCAISPDLRRLWVTATALEHEGGKAVFISDPEFPGKPLVFSSNP